MVNAAPLLALAAARGFDARAARTALRHFADLYGLAGEVLTAEFCGAEFLEKLAEDAAAAGGGGGEDTAPPAKRRRSGAAPQDDVICIASSSDDDAVSDGDDDGGRGGRARPAATVQGRIDSFFSTQNGGARGGKAPAAAAPRRQEAPARGGREDGAHARARPDAAPFGGAHLAGGAGRDAGADDHHGGGGARAPDDFNAMDDLALANRVCFGNATFRPTQRSIWCARRAGVRACTRKPAPVFFVLTALRVCARTAASA
jgi:hypothetical protein